MSFERDEGEYGYIGNLLLHGIAPFNGAYSMKLPGTSFMYAFLMLVFGHTSTGVHMGMIFINAATMCFLFSAFKKIFTPFIGLTTASIYGLMAIGIPFEGFFAHATHFICLYSAIGLLFLADYIKSGKMLKVFLFGLMLGMAFLMKQQALYLILFGIVFLFLYLKTEKKQTYREIAGKIFIFTGGVIIPYLLVVLIVLVTGHFHAFWLWTIEYASKYEATGKSLNDIMGLFKPTFLAAWTNYYYLWLLALSGIVVLYWSAYTHLQKIFVLTYCIASVCTFSSGFYFREHYYITLLPAIGLLTGVFIEFLSKQIRERLNVSKSLNVALLALSVVILFNVYDNRKYYFHYTRNNILFEGPFSVAEEISNYIRNNTKDSDEIAILGSEPEIYFYANRKAATGYLYTYPLVEDQPYNTIMQEQMIQEIEKKKPAFMIFCNLTTSWLAKKNSPTKIFEWGNSYTHDYYTPVGFADLIGPGTWKVYWNGDIKTRNIRPKSTLVILKRKPDNVPSQPM